MKKDGIDRIVEELKTRSIPKQDVFQNTKTHFSAFKEKIKAVAAVLREKMEKIDTRIDVKVVEEEDFAIYLKIAGDTLVCSMHSNVFTFPKEHPLFKKKYIEEDPTRIYCGMITFHNFLSDSFRYKRLNDQGILVARIFINRENHFFVEGHRQLGFLYNDIEHMEMNDVFLEAIIESAILYSLDFELQAPPFDKESQISIQEMRFMTAQAGFRTNKILGYEFSYMKEDKAPPRA